MKTWYQGRPLPMPGSARPRRRVADVACAIGALDRRDIDRARHTRAVRTRARGHTFTPSTLEKDRARARSYGSR